MPRLLMVTTIPETLGAFLLPFARHFRTLGWQVDALAGGPFTFDWAATHFHRTFEIEWSRSPLDPRNLRRAPARLREVVRAGEYDLVHVHTPVAAFVTRLALSGLPRGRRPRVAYTAHGFHFHAHGRPLHNALFLALERLAGRWTDQLVVINREDELAARRHRLVPPGRLRRMPGIGVDTRHYSAGAVSEEDLRRLRAEQSLGPDDPYFLMVAEFIPRKRHADLLRAFARLCADEPPGPRAHLLLAGQGALEPGARRLCAELGITERVRFLGFRPDIPVLLRGACAAVLPSEQEGMPRCLLEAMAVGVPIVATRIRGVTDLLEDDLGLLTEVGDVEGLEAALREVLASPGEAARRAERARERAGQYDVRYVIALHEVLYAEMLRPGRRGAGYVPV